MLYAREVIELMGAYPGREWRMVHIVRHIGSGRKHTLRERNAVRQAVLRVLDSLVEVGTIDRKPPTASRGAPVFYVWKSAT